jgi:hypothetical protein
MIMALALAAAAQGQTAVSGPQITRQEAQQRLTNCGSRRFESVAEFPVNGKVRRARLELCAPDSDSNDAWIATLERNEAQVRAQTALPESAKATLLADLKAEIDKLRGVNALVPAKDLGLAPRSPLQVPKSDFAITGLPPLPPPVRTAPGAPGAVAGAASTVAARRVAPPSLKPRLSVKCAAIGNSPIECSRVAIDEMIVIQAEENLASPLVLTFRQAKSGAEAEVPVGRLRLGQSVRLQVPSAICKGVVRATFEIQVAGTGNGKLPYSDLIGPIKKDC